MREGFHRLSIQERIQRDGEIMRLRQQGCQWCVLIKRFGPSAVLSALGKLGNTTKGGNNNG